MTLCFLRLRRLCNPTNPKSGNHFRRACPAPRRTPTARSLSPPPPKLPFLPIAGPPLTSRIFGSLPAKTSLTFELRQTLKQHVTPPYYRFLLLKLLLSNMAKKCVHKGCGKTYEDDSETCVYHPGPPVFHEGQKGKLNFPKPQP
jgi:hypothetical protein